MGEMKSGTAKRILSPEQLYPGYFALTMATGVLATVTHRLGFKWVDVGFLAIAVLSYVALLAANVVRLATYSAAFKNDFTNPLRGPGFFTAVVGTNVVANALISVENRLDLAWPLWIFSWVLWLAMMYGFSYGMITRKIKPTLENGINGAWLILVVATQSVSIAGSNLSQSSSDPASMLFLSTCMFMLGAALYIFIIFLISYRLVFLPLEAKDFAPTYWVNMGAAAISALAGAELDKRANLWTANLHGQPVLQGFTMLFWIIATAWIPLLLMIGWWRHAEHKIPLHYDPQYWSLVFPLGMYTLCTYSIAARFDLSILRPIPYYFIWLALAAWTATAVGLVRQAVRAWQTRSLPDEVGERRKTVLSTPLEGTVK
jgi:tellurite resistance protein TehA-like permease